MVGHPLTRLTLPLQSAVLTTSLRPWTRRCFVLSRLAGPIRLGRPHVRPRTPEAALETVSSGGFCHVSELNSVRSVVSRDRSFYFEAHRWPPSSMEHPEQEGPAMGRRSATSRTRSREPPKLSREAEAIEDPLVLLAGVRTPIEREPIVPPGVGQLAQLQHGDGHSWSASPEPLGNVLFRPEEIHVASSEDDVFPPRVCRDQAMEAQRLIAGLLPSDRYR